MGNKKKTENNVVPLVDEEELAPFEAFVGEPEQIAGDDHLIRACDGDQHYIYLVTRKPKAKRFHATEVYPRLLPVGQRFKSLDEIVECITEELLGDLEFDEAAVG